MKKARQLLAPISGTKAVLFRKRGSKELYGFFTSKEVPYAEYLIETSSLYSYSDKNKVMLSDSSTNYLNIVS